MWLKFGLILLILTGMLSAFVAGVNAPASVANRVHDWTAALGADNDAETGRDKEGPKAAGTTATTGTGTGAGSGANAGYAANTASASNGTASSAKPVLLATLLGPFSEDDQKARYALLAGQFSSTRAAVDLNASIQARGVQSQVVQAEDSSGSVWALVTAGVFTSAGDAMGQRLALANQLSLSGTMRVLELPAPPTAPTSSGSGAPQSASSTTAAVGAPAVAQTP